MLLGARQFFERRAAPTPPLPYDAEVEYLETDGASYIDLAFLATENTDFDIMAYRASNTVAFGIGCCSNWGRNTYEIATNARFLYWMRGAFSPDTTKVASSYATSQFRIQTSGATITITLIPSGQSAFILSPGTTPFVAPYDMTIFATREGGVVGYSSRGVRIYSARFFNDGDIIRDLVAVRMTNELGQSEGAMYDRLGVGGMNPDGSPRTDGLYRNRGTGAFLYGNDK